MLTSKMKKIVGYIILISLLAVVFSCKEKKGFPQPDDLIGEKQMVEILTDMHISQAYFDNFRFENKLKREESDTLYYSVLNKHGVSDSTFANSVVFYSSMPKIYEKIYQQVIDRLKMEEDTINKKQEVNILPEK
jgi:ubiquinone biosynthesis protein COQ9